MPRAEHPQPGQGRQPKHQLPNASGLPSSQTNKATGSNVSGVADVAFGREDKLFALISGAEAVDRDVQIAVGAESHAGGEVQPGGDQRPVAAPPGAGQVVRITVSTNYQGQ